MKVNAVRNAMFNDDGTITCEVLYAGERRYHPLTVTDDETDPDGQDIYRQLIAGKWGEIKAFELTPEMLEVARKHKRVEITRWREEQERASDTFVFGGRRWDAGRASLERLVLAAARAKFGRLPEGFTWSDADNVQVQLTERRVLALVTAMLKFSAQHEAEIFRRQREMKDELEKLADLKLIREFDVE